MSSHEEHPLGKEGHRKGLQNLSVHLGYVDGPSNNLQTAFTHRSFANETLPKVDHNERLEFLGDAVLDLVVAEVLMQKFPSVDEGELHRLRTTLVRTESLAQFARNLELGRLIRLGKGELKANGRDKDSLLANAFEAMVGALYLDRGFRATRVEILGIIEETLAKTSIGDGMTFDPKSRLQEQCQFRHGQTPIYRLTDTRGPEHAKLFEIEVVVAGRVMGIGTGRSKKAAERSAARAALAAWED